jgi:hypothetical protein
VANRSSIIIGGVVGSAGLAHSRVRHAGDDPTLQASARGGGCTQVPPRGPSGYLSARQGAGCSVVDADFVPLRQRTHTNYVAAIHVPRAKGTGRVAVDDSYSRWSRVYSRSESTAVGASAPSGPI